MGVKDAVRYGLVTQRVINRAKGMGVTINPYYLFLERPTGTLPEPPGEGFTASLLAAEDLEAAAARSTWATVEVFRERVDRGHVCVVVKNGNEIAGYTWADLSEVNDSACDFALEPGEAYLYDAFIVPEHRGQALAPFMRTCCYMHLQAAGVQRFYSISDYFNTPAIRFKLKLDASIVRLYLELKLGSRQLGQWVLKEYQPPR
jgi:hypothetical protein